MFGIIVAFPKLEDADKIKGMLVKNGFDVQGVCTSGAMAIRLAGELEKGILVCGCKFPDMTCREIKENLSYNISMLVIASKRVWDSYGGENIIFLEMPIKSYQLVKTLEMMISVSEKHKKKKTYIPKTKSDEEKEIVLKAKLTLMEKNNFTEEEAYRYIQKNSMDSGNSMADTASMLLSIMDFRL